MMTQVDAVKQRNAELKKRAERETIVHETVPGADPIQSDQTSKDRVTVSTANEDIN